MDTESLSSRKELLRNAMRWAILIAGGGTVLSLSMRRNCRGDAPSLCGTCAISGECELPAAIRQRSWRSGDSHVG